MLEDIKKLVGRLNVNENIKLSTKEMEEIHVIAIKPDTPDQVKKRAKILISLSKGASYEEAARKSDTSVSTVERTVAKYHKGGVKSALTLKPRSGAPHVLTKKQTKHVIAMAKSGNYKSTQDIADKLMSSNSNIDHISDETVRKILDNAGINL